MLYSDQEKNKLIINNPENLYIKERVDNIYDNLENPYAKIYEWIEEEELDIEALLETINYLNNLNEQCEKLYQKREENKIDIYSVKVTTGLKSIFSFKTVEEERKELEEERKNIENELKEILDLSKICYFAMEKFIIEFKELKIYSYYKCIKKFSIDLKMNNAILNDLWNCLEKDNNLKDYIGQE